MKGSRAARPSPLGHAINTDNFSVHTATCLSSATRLDWLFTVMTNHIHDSNAGKNKHYGCQCYREHNEMKATHVILVKQFRFWFAIRSNRVSANLWRSR